MAGLRVAENFQTPRLLLRRMEIGDAQALHVFFRDPEAMEFWSTPHATLAETESWVHGTVNAPDQQTREYVLVYNGVTIGKAGMWKKPELGYFIARQYWGKGLMTEALKVLLPHLHVVMDAPVITAEITPENHASAALLAKLGFQEVRRAEKDHWDGQKWCDTAFYERSRDTPMR